MDTVIGTPQERFDQRLKRAREVGERNAIVGTFKGVGHGTRTKLRRMCKRNLLPMDALLWKLARLGEKHGI